MPAPIDRGTKEQIVVLRALDYSKSDIAEELDISRHTVRTYLEQIREQIESESNQKVALVKFLTDEKPKPYDKLSSVQKSDDNFHVL